MHAREQAAEQDFEEELHQRVARVDAADSARATGEAARRGDADSGVGDAVGRRVSPTGSGSGLPSSGAISAPPRGTRR